VAPAPVKQNPDAEPPSDLEARTIAAVQYAAMTASQPGDACCR